MPKQASRPFATIQRHKISEFRKIPNMLKKRKLPEQVTITIPLSTKTTENVFLLGKAKKESVPTPSLPSHKMALNYISSRSRRWDEVSSCKEPWESLF